MTVRTGSTNGSAGAGKGTGNRTGSWVVMGVCGSGKSAIAARMALALGVRFLEGDTFHTPANVAKMAAGIALQDDDRAVWLEQLASELQTAREQGVAVVLSCSALKRQYRDVLRRANPALRFLHLHAGRDLLAARMQNRGAHYMPLSLLDSQLAALEPLQPDEAGIVLDARRDPAMLLADILALPR